MRAANLVKNIFNIQDFFRSFVSGWLFATFIEYTLLPVELRSLAHLDGLAQMSFGRVIIVTVVTTALIYVASRLVQDPKVFRWILFGVFAITVAITMVYSFTWQYFAICLIMLALFAVYSCFGWDHTSNTLSEHQKSNKIFVWITVALSVLFFVLIGAWTVCRVRSFSSSTYDFGIFAQMFHNMKESGLPYTTLERDGLLSHFDVHMSPIYYLMLPFYCLFPYSETLQILQALVVASAVIPLWKLAKRHGLSDFLRMAVCILLLLYPAFSGGVSYDLHENCFLTPLILWLFYAIDTKNIVLTAASALLVLLVKEDAAMYVAVIAVWLIVRALVAKQKNVNDVVAGALLLVVSLMYFGVVTSYLADSGDGVMTNRFDNFIYDGSSSLVAVIKAVVMCPMKAVFECVDIEKLKFIAQTMLPLLGLPLLTRKYERYILLIPYVLLNLMSDYVYQHDIFFQYNFGPTAFLFYLVVINLADIKINKHKIVAVTSSCAVSLTFFCSLIIPQSTYYMWICMQADESYDQIREVLSEIPDDAAVTCYGFYTPYLSQREILYDVRYASKEHILSSDYVILGGDSESEFAFMGDNGYVKFVNMLKYNGFTQYIKLDGEIEIYAK